MVWKSKYGWVDKTIGVEKVIQAKGWKVLDLQTTGNTQMCDQEQAYLKIWDPPR